MMGESSSLLSIHFHSCFPVLPTFFILFHPDLPATPLHSFPLQIHHPFSIHIYQLHRYHHFLSSILPFTLLSPIASFSITISISSSSPSQSFLFSPHLPLPYISPFLHIFPSPPLPLFLLTPTTSPSYPHLHLLFLFLLFLTSSPPPHHRTPATRGTVRQ